MSQVIRPRYPKCGNARSIPEAAAAEGVTSRPATVEDAKALVLRPEDHQEALLYNRGVPPAGLVAAIQASIKAEAYVDGQGRLVAIAGLVVDGDKVYPWMRSSALVEAHGKLILRIGRALVAELRGSGYFACNYIGKEAISARKFIQRLGFVIVPAPAGPFDFFYLPSEPNV